MPKRKAKIEPSTDTVDSAVSNAFSGIEELRDELQEWYDNLHENFQNGSKGEALQEAISALEQNYEPSAPDCASGLTCSWIEGRAKSRAARRDIYVAMLDGAISAIDDRIQELKGMTFDEKQVQVADPAPAEASDDEDFKDTSNPCDENARDNMVSELESYRDEMDNAKSDWESVEFPGMYG